MNRKKLDQDALISDLLAGGMTLTAIADKHNLSVRQLGRILAGESRPSIKARLAVAARLAGLELRRTVSASLPDLVRLHIQAAMGDGPDARRCREFLLKHHLDETPQPPEEAQARRPNGMTRELQRIRRRLRRDYDAQSGGYEK